MSLTRVACELAASTCVIIAMRLSSGVEVEAVPGNARGLQRSRGIVRRLAALFALDSFAGGFVLQSLLVYWLYAHFALTPAAIGAVSKLMHISQPGQCPRRRVQEEINHASQGWADR